MHRNRIALIAVVITLAAATAIAQTSAPPPTSGTPVMDGSGCKAMMEQHETTQKQMAAMDASLQGLVETMNHTTGSARVDAMAAVINELVRQRTAMREQMMTMHPAMMHQMMEHGCGECPMRKGMGKSEEMEHHPSMHQ